jgi:hypothetical protein
MINGLQQVFEKWVERCKKCIVCQGRYVEKETVTAPPRTYLPQSGEPEYRSQYSDCATDWRAGIRFQTGAENCSQATAVANPAYYPIGTGGSFLGGTAAGA